MCVYVVWVVCSESHFSGVLQCVAACVAVYVAMCVALV